MRTGKRELPLDDVSVNDLQPHFIVAAPASEDRAAQTHERFRALESFRVCFPHASVILDYHQ